MIAIVVSEDLHLQQTLSELLKKLGYLIVYVTASVDEADYFFTKEQKKIKLILFENNPAQGLDIPLARLIIQKQTLDLTPLIHISNSSLPTFSASNGPDQLSRIDHELAKPFGIRQLKLAIQLAKRRRAKLRNKLLVLGNKYETNAVEAMYNTNVHWKKILFTSNFEDFKEQIETLQFRLGGIVIEPIFNSPEVIEFLEHFKKSTTGSFTQLVILSKKPSEILPFRDYGDLYFDLEETSWNDILETTSKRSIYHGDAIDALLEAKAFIKSHQPRKAIKIVDAALKLDPKRWELLESAGAIHKLLGHDSKSIEFYQTSLADNPCNPSVYIHLNKLLKDQARQELIQLGHDYCPYHPEIKSLAQHES